MLYFNKYYVYNRVQYGRLIQQWSTEYKYTISQIGIDPTNHRGDYSLPKQQPGQVSPPSPPRGPRVNPPYIYVPRWRAQHT